MKIFLLQLSLWVFLLTLIQMQGYKACLEKERIALLEIKNFFISISDKEYAGDVLTSWVDDDGMSDCCGWEGVQCNATTDRVMQLSLNKTRQINPYNSRNSSHGLPILNLSLYTPFQELRSLDLSGNDFEGWKANKVHPDDSFGSFKQLESLNLGNSFFNDSVLQYVSRITSLRTLILRGNEIKDLKGIENLKNLKVLDVAENIISPGSLIKLGMANFRNLRTLDVRSNNIRGSLESQGICELKNLFELDISQNKFGGSLPKCLNNLTHLKFLDMSANQLSGNLPSALANLTSLEYLNLYDNNFDGIFSLNPFANHSNLKVFLLSTKHNRLQVKTENFLPTFQLKILHLQNCNLNGTIPSFLRQQYDLRVLVLSHNKLVGNLSTWLLESNAKLEILILKNNSLTGNLHLPNLTHDLFGLDISSNKFIGKLPQNMGIILRELLYLDMSKNRFEGDIPSSIGDIKELRLLDLSRNHFAGELPRPLLAGCNLLMLLNLSDNNLYGQMFPKYMNLTQLGWLYLGNNQFSGKIDDGLQTSTQLEGLDISNNMLSGQIPHWIGNFSILYALSMSKNLLEGNIPSELNNLKRLQILNLSKNRLSGFKRSSFNLSSITHLYLQNNALVGTIPSSLFQNSRLMTLDLRENKFFGRIPLQIYNKSDVRVLLLGGNNLQGYIPNQLCQLQKLGILDLSRNRLNGSIPSCFGNMLFWKIRDGELYGSELERNKGLFVYSIGSSYKWSLELSVTEAYSTFIDQQVIIAFVTKNRNEFYSGLPLNYMSGLDLSCNELSGEIPSEIGELQEIRGLNLSYNSFSGSIPKSFSNLKNVESLDLSHNKLSGRIPPQLTNLNFLSTFNVSYNNLSGSVPNYGQFATFDDRSYRGNSGLCGKTINQSCISPAEVSSPSSYGGEEDESPIDMVSFIWSFVASFVTFIFVLFATLLANTYWRRQWFCFIDTFIDLCCYGLCKIVYFIPDYARE